MSTPISVLVGERRTFTITIKDQAGNLVDLTGLNTIFAVAAKLCDGTKPNSPIFVLSTNTTPAQVVNKPQAGATLGQVDVTVLPANNTAKAQDYFYNVWIEAAADDRKPAIRNVSVAGCSGETPCRTRGRPPAR